MNIDRTRCRFAYLIGEKWFWLVVSPVFFVLPEKILWILTAWMSAYALYLTADGRLEAARARRAAEQ